MSARAGVGWRVWAGLLLAPAAWAVHHQVGAYMNFANCRTGDGPVLILIGLAMFVVALFGGGFSVMAWRTARGPDHEGGNMKLFLGALGMMGSFLFGLTILVQTAAAVILPPCFR